MSEGQRVLELANEIHFAARKRIGEVASLSGLYYESSNHKFGPKGLEVPGQSRYLVCTQDLRLLVDYTRAEAGYDEVMLTVRNHPEDIIMDQGYRVADVIEYVIHSPSLSDLDPEIHAYKYEEHIPDNPLHHKRYVIGPKNFYISPTLAPNIMRDDRTFLLPGIPRRFNPKKSVIRVFNSEALEKISDSLLNGSVGMITSFDRPLEKILE